ncbi:MAG: pilus assembly PilX N-terminal domain-containing protein [Pyrinomonadaceae bacterium]
MESSNPKENLDNRRNERGAALVISLLVSMILLVAGGALIQVTSMSAANAIDSTAETQAYYGAEAGLQAAVNALRRNDAPTASAMPTGMTGMNFRNAVLPNRSNDCPNGAGSNASLCSSTLCTGCARLTRWLPYSNTQAMNTRVTVGTNPTIQYEVIVSLPPGDTMPAAPADPGRLLVQSIGYGPSGSRKQMSMIVSRSAFDPAVPAMMTLIGTPAGAPPMSFESGNSANHVYSGVDNATGVATGLPAFGTTNAIDTAIAISNAASNTTSSPAAATLSSSSVPAYLQSPAAARTFLDQMQAAAIAGAAQTPRTATYLPNGGSGNPTGFTFVKGDYTMGSGSGSGIIIVTGELTTNGGTDFNGICLVIGAGYVNRNGGGGGAFYGANFIARVDWPAQSPALTAFGSPFFNFNGGGNATMQYDSTAVANALALLPAPVLGVSEY